MANGIHVTITELCTIKATSMLFHIVLYPRQVMGNPRVNSRVPRFGALVAQGNDANHNPLVSRRLQH